MTSAVVSATRRPLPALLVYVGAVVAVSVLGGLATTGATSAGGWYATADKPFFTPPDWLFGPVWTVLYAAMALAAWRLSRVRAAAGPAARSAEAALRLWWVQLGLNLAWTPLFFGLQWLWAGVADIVLLDLLLVLLVVRAWRLDRPAGLLLAPYLAWVLYATALSVGVASLR